MKRKETKMKRSLVIALTIALCGALTANQAYANHEDRDEDGHNKSLTLAVYGDWPYSTELLAQAPLLIDSINSDPEVRLVIHVGDIHSGSMPCTGAGLTPLPATANPLWNQGIFDLFQQFNDPVVYTPGDNEWTDCHKTKQGTSGDPLKELTAVRSLFFAHPGQTLGGRKKRVLTQAEEFHGAHSPDAQFVENVMWEDSRVIFVTLNMPGSNNDGLPWSGGTASIPGPPYPASPFLNEPARMQEVADRTAADIRWLKAAFKEAREEGAKAVLIALQADMWDPAALVTGGDGLDGYTSFVQTLADLCVRFGRPVLLINGDSHVFEVDQPLADPNSATGKIHKTQAVPNLTRITVEGSTAANEWLRLTLNPHTPEVFSWERIQYLP
jgi:hypothetical protein